MTGFAESVRDCDELSGDSDNDNLVGFSSSAQAIRAHLATIPTSLKISDCDADLMELAAHDVVRRALRENAHILESVGLQQ